MAGRFTCLSLINKSESYPPPDSELAELIERASDIIVVLDLDEVGEDIVTSAIDGEIAEPLPEQLAPRINAWARHGEKPEPVDLEELVRFVKEGHSSQFATDAEIVDDYRRSRREGIGLGNIGG